MSRQHSTFIGTSVLLCITLGVRAVIDENPHLDQHTRGGRRHPATVVDALTPDSGSDHAVSIVFLS